MITTIWNSPSSSKCFHWRGIATEKVNLFKNVNFFGEEIKWDAKLSLSLCSPSLLSTYCSDQSDISTCSGTDGGNFPPDGDLHSPVHQLGASISASSISRSAGQKGGAGETHKHDHPWEVNRESLLGSTNKSGPLGCSQCVGRGGAGRQLGPDPAPFWNKSPSPSSVLSCDSSSSRTQLSATSCPCSLDHLGKYPSWELC